MFSAPHTSISRFKMVKKGTCGRTGYVKPSNTEGTREKREVLGGGRSSGHQPHTTRPNDSSRNCPSSDD